MTSQINTKGLDSASAAALIARMLKAQGVKRIFTLCGGHIMPVLMEAQAAGIALVDVRDERAAVYMAHAHAELTGGLGVALVTAGPGVTNAMTGIANAHIARAPVLVLSGLPPRAQDNRGALQDLPHTEFVRPSRATRAACATRRWCCRNWARPSRARWGRAVTRARCTWTSPPTCCAPPCPPATQLAEHFVPRRRRCCGPIRWRGAGRRAAVVGAPAAGDQRPRRTRRRAGA
jgi:acetolactate synthase-1/2/3 large subunit